MVRILQAIGWTLGGIAGVVILVSTFISVNGTSGPIYDVFGFRKIVTPGPDGMTIGPSWLAVVVAIACGYGCHALFRLAERLKQRK